MSSKVEVKDLLDIQWAGDDRKLTSIIRSALGRRELMPLSQPLWKADFFSLDRCKIFNQSTPAEKNEILRGCCDNLLTEAYAIEKLGMGFTAKMSLLAETLEERMLYSIFAHDEAAHFYQISQFLEEPLVATLQNPFIKLLTEIIEGEAKSVLIFVIQVVLEGWGLSHYRMMHEDCTSEDFRKLLKKILRDEAKHHASGTALLGQREMDDWQYRRAAELLSQMFQMVQSGPQAVVAQIERIKGSLSFSDKVTVFEELGAERESQGRLELLRALIPSSLNPVSERLEKHKLFKAYSAQECASI